LSLFIPEKRQKPKSRPAYCKRLVKIGEKDWKKDWQRLDVFFLSTHKRQVMPEKGKGKAKGGQDHVKVAAVTRSGRRRREKAKGMPRKIF
jgi:hypothetical protein